MHIDGAAQVAFVLGGLLGQDVTLKGLTAFDGSTGTNTEALFALLLVFILGI